MVVVQGNHKFCTLLCLFVVVIVFVSLTIYCILVSVLNSLFRKQVKPKITTTIQTTHSGNIEEKKRTRYDRVKMQRAGKSHMCEMHAKSTLQ